MLHFVWNRLTAICYLPMYDSLTILKSISVFMVRLCELVCNNICNRQWLPSKLQSYTGRPKYLIIYVKKSYIKLLRVKSSRFVIDQWPYLFGRSGNPLCAALGVRYARRVAKIQSPHPLYFQDSSWNAPGPKGSERGWTHFISIIHFLLVQYNAQSEPADLQSKAPIRPTRPSKKDMVTNGLGEN